MYAFTQTSLKRKTYCTIKFNLWILIREDLCTLLFIGLKIGFACNKIRMKVLIFYTIILVVTDIA